SAAVLLRWKGHKRQTREPARGRLKVLFRCRVRTRCKRQSRPVTRELARPRKPIGRKSPLFTTHWPELHRRQSWSLIALSRIRWPLARKRGSNWLMRWNQKHHSRTIISCQASAATCLQNSVATTRPERSSSERRRSHRTRGNENYSFAAR